MFNASLVLFGTLLVCNKADFQDLFTSSNIHNMRGSVERAVEVLTLLDNGNAMIARCRECLCRLVQIYDSMGRAFRDFRFVTVTI